MGVRVGAKAVGALADVAHGRQLWSLSSREQFALHDHATQTLTPARAHARARALHTGAQISLDVLFRDQQLEWSLPL